MGREDRPKANELFSKSTLAFSEKVVFDEAEVFFGLFISRKRPRQPEVIENVAQLRDGLDRLPLLFRLIEEDRVSSRRVPPMDDILKLA